MQGPIKPTPPTPPTSPALVNNKTVDISSGAVQTQPQNTNLSTQSKPLQNSNTTKAEQPAATVSKPTESMQQTIPLSNMDETSAQTTQAQSPTIYKQTTGSSGYGMFSIVLVAVLFGCVFFCWLKKRMAHRYLK